jgi:hypothetical protein
VCFGFLVGGGGAPPPPPPPPPLPLPHLPRRVRMHPAAPGTGLTAAASALRLGSSRPRLCRDWAHPTPGDLPVRGSVLFERRQDREDGAARLGHRLCVLHGSRCTIISTLSGIIGTLSGIIGTLSGIIRTLSGIIRTLSGIIRTLSGIIRTLGA